MQAVRYRVEHETRYIYDAPVSQSWQLARLTPRALPWQRVLSHSLQIDPPPDARHDALDSFGNIVTHFGLHGAHRRLRVHMQCDVEVGDRPATGPSEGVAWEDVRQATRLPAAGARVDLDAACMSEPTPLLPLSEAARAYAVLSLKSGRQWLDAIEDLTHRIHADFEFEPGATTVSTSVDEVLYQRRGVCQDFAHLMLACLRGHGLPARYVSGYLLTDPPPGEPRLIGVDASHAWVAAHSPIDGWVEFDPTNGQRADRRYVTLAWGRDYGDVAPLRGVIQGGGAVPPQVAVTVHPMPG
jgi:transglutaminase-like putative cysteine protease